MNKLTKLLTISLFASINSINAEVIRFTNLKALSPNAYCSKIKWLSSSEALSTSSLSNTVEIPSVEAKKFQIICRGKPSPKKSYSHSGTDIVPGKTYNISVNSNLNIETK